MKQTTKTNYRNRSYDLVTDKIIALLERGITPWHQTWTAANAPRNLSSGKPYRCVNAVLLAAVAIEKGYKSPYWLTFRQAKERGGSVRKGEESTPVVFWKLFEVRENGDTSQESERSDNKGWKRFPYLKYYRVFNVEQCDGID